MDNTLIILAGTGIVTAVRLFLFLDAERRRALVIARIIGSIPARCHRCAARLGDVHCPCCAGYGRVALTRLLRKR